MAEFAKIFFIAEICIFFTVQYLLILPQTQKHGHNPGSFDLKVQPIHPPPLISSENPAIPPPAERSPQVTPPRPSPEKPPSPPPIKYHALFYMMACLPDWEQNKHTGGPQGELIMKESLARGLRALGYEPEEAASLQELRTKLKARHYDAVFTDPFMLGDCDAIIPRNAGMPGAKQRWFVLEFFGKPPPDVPAHAPLQATSYLTPYPTPGNTFLGYIIDPVAPRAKAPGQGLVWGKEAKYFTPGNMAMLASLFTPEQRAHNYSLHTTVTAQRGYYAGLFPPDWAHVNHQHLPRDRFVELLARSEFVIGLGHPIAGPTAIEALAAGCVLVNPVWSPPFLYQNNARIPFPSQTPYADRVGAPRVCTVDLTTAQGHAQMHRCLAESRQALAKMTPAERFVVPRDFTHAAYVERLAAILDVPAPA